MLHGAYHWSPENVLGYERDMLPAGETLDFVSLTAPEFRSAGQFWAGSLGELWGGTQQDITDLMGPSTSRHLLTHMTPHDGKTFGNTAPYDYTPFFDGQYDDQVRAAAQMLVDGGVPDAFLVIGGEWNNPTWTFGNYPVGGASTYNDMFARMVSLLSSVDGTDFRYIIQVAGPVGEAHGCDPMSSSYWPAGQDPPTFEITFYDNAFSCYQGLPEDQITEQMREDCWFNHTKPKLEEYVGIANSIGSPVCTKEWGGEKAADAGRGNGGGDDPFFIHRAFDFFHANNFTMEGYWNGAPHSIWPIDDPTDLVQMGQAWQEEVAADIAGGGSGGGNGGTTGMLGNYTLPAHGQTGWVPTLNTVWDQLENDVSNLAGRYDAIVAASYAKPAPGSDRAAAAAAYQSNLETLQSDVAALATAAGVSVSPSYGVPDFSAAGWDSGLNDDLTQAGLDLQAIAAGTTNGGGGGGGGGTTPTVTTVSDLSRFGAGWTNVGLVSSDLSSSPLTPPLSGQAVVAPPDGADKAAWDTDNHQPVGQGERLIAWIAASGTTEWSFNHRIRFNVEDASNYYDVSFNWASSKVRVDKYDGANYQQVPAGTRKTFQLSQPAQANHWYVPVVSLFTDNTIGIEVLDGAYGEGASLGGLTFGPDTDHSAGTGIGMQAWQNSADTLYFGGFQKVSIA